MRRNLILAQNERMGNIQRCCHGVVHIHILHHGISVRFTEDAFLEFASMVKEASSRLMDEHLADLLGDKNYEAEQ